MMNRRKFLLDIASSALGTSLWKPTIGASLPLPLAWGMQLPPPIRPLLSKVNWQQKTVIPFNTNAGYGLGSSLDELEKMVQGANLRPILSIRGGIERDGILLNIKGQRAREVNQQVIAWLKQK